MYIYIYKCMKIDRHVSIHIFIYVHTHTYVYIYIEREREREICLFWRGPGGCEPKQVCLEKRRRCVQISACEL